MYDYFVTVSCNWADEMDIFGYSFMNKEEVNQLKKKLKNKGTWFSIYVGSNQEIEFDSGEELLECLEFMKIKDENEFKVLNKFMGNENYCPTTPEKILETLCDEYDDESLDDESYDSEDDF